LDDSELAQHEAIGIGIHGYLSRIRAGQAKHSRKWKRSLFIVEDAERPVTRRRAGGDDQVVPGIAMSP
jgi:hypothetical protein